MSATSVRSGRLSPAARKRLERKVLASYAICKGTLARARKVLQARPDPELRRLADELERNVGKMESVMGRQGMEGWPLLILLAGTAVAGLIGSVGISKFISSKVPEISQEQVQQAIKITVGVSLIGIGIYAVAQPTVLRRKLP